MSDIIFTDTQRAVNQTKGREEMEREKPTIKNNLTNAIKTDLHWKEDMICFDKNRWSIKKIADYIIKHRKEIGLYKKSDFEIDLADAKEVIWRTYINMSPFNHINWDKFAEGIAKKNPIKIKVEK